MYYAIQSSVFFNIIFHTYIYIVSKTSNTNGKPMDDDFLLNTLHSHRFHRQKYDKKTELQKIIIVFR